MESKEINFQLKGIDLHDVTMNRPETFLPKEYKYNLDVNIQHKIIGNEKTIIVTPAITISIDEEKLICGIVKVSFLYLVANLEEFQKKDSAEFDLPDSFITSLNSISLSTTRGIMFSHFKGTFLHNAILPIVNPTDFKRDQI